MNKKQLGLTVITILVIILAYNIKYFSSNVKLMLLTPISIGSFFIAYGLISYYKSIPIKILSICMIITITLYTLKEYIMVLDTGNRTIIRYLNFSIGVTGFLMLPSSIYHLLASGDNKNRNTAISALILFTIVGLGIAYILIKF